MTLIWQGWRRQAETCRSVFKEPSCNCLINLKLRKRCGCTTLSPTLNSLKVPLQHLASDKPQWDFGSEIVNLSNVIIKHRPMFHFSTLSLTILSLSANEIFHVYLNSMQAFNYFKMLIYHRSILVWWLHCIFLIILLFLFDIWRVSIWQRETVGYLFNCLIMLSLSHTPPSFSTPS